MLAIDRLSIALGENEITGLVNLNMAGQVPFLTAELSSSKFEIGPASLNLHLTGPIKRPAIKKLDLKFGTEELAKVSLNGVVDDLLELSYQRSVEGILDTKINLTGRANQWRR